MIRKAIGRALDKLVGLGLCLAESGLLPDVIVRAGIRLLLAQTMTSLNSEGNERAQEQFMLFVNDLKSREIAEKESVDKANEEHYELPTDFFKLCLGESMKYSCSLFEQGNETLKQAEDAMLAKTCERAGLAADQKILELGCGWGSLALHVASKFPTSQITAVSNSRTQKEHIDAVAKRKRLENITVITADMNEFKPPEGEERGHFDRVVSVEMFEHMKNYELLLRRIHEWLRPNGLLFIHMFVHKSKAYHFTDNNNHSDWMAKHFFSGGTLPSDCLLLYFLPASGLRIKGHWHVDGRHYARTARHWLCNTDRHKDAIQSMFPLVYGKKQANTWFNRWRMFYLTCEEFWRTRNGTEWFVSHYSFQKE